MFLFADTAKKHASPGGFTLCPWPRQSRAASSGHSGSGPSSFPPGFSQGRPLPSEPRPLLSFGAFPGIPWGSGVFPSTVLSVLDWLPENARKEPVPKSPYSDVVGSAFHKVQKKAVYARGNRSDVHDKHTINPS